MSFEAQNNVIRVTDTNGEVVFDTGTPMPHIATTITAQVTHTFPDSGDQPIIVEQKILSPTISGCEEYGCNQEYICNQEYVCNQVYRCRQEYVCEYDFSAGRNVCGYQTVCGYVEECGFENVCAFETVCDFEPVQGYQTAGGNRVLAKEHSQQYTLGSVPSGTFPDFLLVFMTASRTSAGAQADYGTFISAIPTGQKIACNGSTVLESTYIPGGAPWLSRIVSVYLSGEDVVAEFKHSNRQYDGRKVKNITQACFGFPSPPPAPDTTSSTWSINFEAYVGKFTT
jgi:hypothetical protein